MTWAQSDLLHEWRLDPRPIPAPRTGSAPIPAIPERVPILAISMGYMLPALPRSDVPEFERGSAPFMIKAWHTGGKEAFSASAGALSFIIEAILVFDRRFLIG